MTTQTYERVTPDSTESITVHSTPDGYVRMRTTNLHDLLLHIGFQPTEPKEHH